MKKKIIIVVFTCLLIILGLFTLYKGFMDPYRGSVNDCKPSQSLETMLTKKEAQKDLSYMMKTLKGHHPAYLEDEKELLSQVEAQYQKELENMPEEVSVLALWQSAGRILSLLHDGHSWVNFDDQQEALYINDFTQLENYGCPKSINNEPIEDIKQRFLQLYSYESEEYAIAMFESQYVISQDYLRYCGVDVTNGVSMVYETEQGLQEYSYHFVPYSAVVCQEKDSSEEEYKFVDYQIDKKHNLGIFTLNECKYNDTYKAVVNEFFQKIKEQDIENIVIDLRGNGGGNSEVANYFLSFLNVDEYKTWGCDIRYGWLLWKYKGEIQKNQKQTTVFDGNLYVLTDIYTYSSAMDFTMLIKDNSLGIIVGEASGNKPEGYGDCIYFQLPNSKLLLSISGKLWYRIDRSKADEFLLPDIEIAPNQAMEKIYEIIGLN